METHRLSIERGEPPGHLSSAILPLMTTRNQPGRGNDKAEFHVAHKSLASDYSPEITCTSWPIWDRGLAHCSSPESLSLGNKPHESLWMYLP